LSEGFDVPAAAPPTVGRYAYPFVGGLLTVYIVGLIAVARFAREPEPRAERVLGPMFACVALTALVWLAMVVMRNWAVMTKRANPRYFLAYREAAPPDFIERPARVFNNLLQLPQLFYIVCLAMLATHALDRAQLIYAWCFVGMRVVHAIVYLGWNHLPVRFITWTMGVITLGTLWVRLAFQVWPQL
jgi:hypothetical protein